MPEPIQQPEQSGDEPDTEAEFRALWTDADEGRTRLESLAKAADASGQAESAKVYREIGGTVMTLLMDLAAATGGAIVNLETEIDEVTPGAGPTPDESGLLPEDAEKYLQLFEQYIRLLDGLNEVVPKGSEGDAQREVFATLRRMTDGMAEYTRSIILDDEEAEPEDDDDEEEPEEEAPGDA